ncbi:MBL fold metallo-hydrolase [Roseateles sp.]|uniref:MBL fold metallo-hydrolase n=1 Tax=Roseateles sp. TaxID=1971397 RepID=UPI0025E3ADB9|nr:MBL fold metallo-hydrolase [Roseateles sp.]MBV8037668.1 MBL fold metallo-hydrolase [Roseateles sp.]
MKRLATLLLAWWAAAAIAAPLTLQPVAPNVWFVQGEAALGSAQNRNFISNAGVVVTPAGVIVIDALGSPALAESLLEAIRAVTLQPVRYVVLTHYHADHVYGLQVFKDRGATIIAHEAGREYLQSDAAQLRLQASRETLAPWVDAHTRLVPADRWLHDDEVLELGGVRLQLRHVGPAHTPEDLTVFVEGARVLFAGDLVFRGRIPYVGQADSRGWIAALSRLIAAAPAVIVPGHGPASTEALADLKLTRDYLQYLRDTMGRAAADMQPFDEAYAGTDWSAFEALPLFRAANRMNAYNTYLLMERGAP